MHLDGARIFNASVYLDVPLADLVKDFDTVNVCFSKGMGCPVGSMIMGTEKHIMKALEYRKMLGGGMR